MNSESPQSEQDALADAEANAAHDFQAAAEEENMSLIAEFLLFLRENKAWWMVPILLALALIAAAVLMGGSPLAPFIYPLF